MFISKFGKVYFDEGAAGGAATGGAGNTGNSTGATGSSDQAGSSADQAGDDKEAKGGKPKGKITFTSEQQVAIDEIIKERLLREQKHADTEAQKIRQQAEEDALAKNKEFETLASTRQNKIVELEKLLAESSSFKDEADEYRGAMEKIVKAQIEKLPKPIQVLLAKLNPLEQMDYITEHAKDLNIEIIGVPETQTGDPSTKLTKEAEAKARKNNETVVKSFLSR